MTVEITRKDFTVADLRAAAGRTKDARAARRMLAIALVMDGANRTTAAEACGMDRQTLRGEEDKETVRGTVSPTNAHCYNAEGLAGLANRRPPGAKPLLTPEQKAELAALVEAGPDPERDGLCAGGGSIFRRRSRRGSTWRCTSARQEFNWRQATGRARFPASFGAAAAPEDG